MVDSHVVLARIDKIRECITKLNRLRSSDEEAFLNDEPACDSAERNIQIAIQAVIDIGNHLVADKDLGTPKDYKDIFRMLAQHGLIPEQLSAKLISMTGLRNVLVHDYLQVDRRMIYSILTAELAGFEEFIAAVLKFL